jgi:glycosyltransferase involved in cell wall biosynthesis
MKRQIIQIVQHLQPGGIEALALEIQRFSEPGDEVHIISLEGEKYKAIKQWSILEERTSSIHFLNKQSGISITLIYKLLKMINLIKPSVIHTHHIGPLIYGGIACRLKRIPFLIHTEHDAWHLKDNKRRLIQKSIIKLVKPIIVADAKYVAKKIKQYIPNIKPVIIHNGVDVDRYYPMDKHSARRALKLPKNVPLIGCAARLHPVKGHDVLIKAINTLPVHVHLALAGTGKEHNSLKNLVDDLNLSKRVHFLGHVDDLPSFYHASDLVCLASFNEGLPLSPLEAQACGIPVVLTDVGGCREALCQNTGILVEARDSACLARALNFQLNRNVTKTPRQFIKQQRSLNTMVHAYNLLTKQIQLLGE